MSTQPGTDGDAGGSSSPVAFITGASRGIGKACAIELADAGYRIAITARTGDRAMRDRLAALDHRATTLALACERAFLAVLDGSCRTPIAGLARIDGGELSFDGMIVKPDGSEAHVWRHGLVLRQFSELAQHLRDALG